MLQGVYSWYLFILQQGFSNCSCMPQDSGFPDTSVMENTWAGQKCLVGSGYHSGTLPYLHINNVQIMQNRADYSLW